MVVFRLRGENILTERLLKRLNARGNVHCVPAALKDKYVIRFTVTSAQTTSDDILQDWAEIKTVALEILQESGIDATAPRVRVPLAGTVFEIDTNGFGAGDIKYGFCKSITSNY